MKIGIIGPAMSGKSTLFRLLTGATATTGKGGIPQGAAKIPDKRLETLSTVFRPQKTIFATVEFTDFPALGAGGEMSGELTSRLKTLDALAVVVRAHQDPAVPWPAEPTSPAAAFSAFLEEMILTDLVQVEKHLSRNKDKKRTPAETRLLERCRELLENMKPLAGASWREDELPILRNYAFLSLRPVLVADNLDEAQLQEGSYLSEEAITKLCRESEYPLLTFCVTLE